MRSIPYNPSAAVAYAHLWAYSRNPLFADFDGMGGDCTNFVSQCLLAGGAVMNYIPITGWYFRHLRDRTAAWSGVAFMHRFLTANEGVGPQAREVERTQARAGDIVQLSFDGVKYTHSGLIVTVEQGTTTEPRILIAAHTLNSDHRSLDSYSYVTARFLHIANILTEH